MLGFLEQRFALAVRQRELLEGYIKQRLQPTKHFYKVRDTDKPSLNKEGAELICLAHAYKPEYDIIAGPDQPPEDDKAYQITVKCRLSRSGAPVGEGLGSASSHVTRRDGDRVPRQPDIGLRHNTTLKMAQKSAYIAATLNSTAASEFFTQDIEDGGVMSRAPETAQVEAPQAGHYCSAHKTAWFKRGNMRGYAHPIDGQPGQWCNEPTARQVPSAPPQSAPSVRADEEEGRIVGEIGDEVLDEEQAEDTGVVLPPRNAKTGWPLVVEESCRTWNQDHPDKQLTRVKVDRYCLKLFGRDVEHLDVQQSATLAAHIAAGEVT